jgi:hypothetical protein
MILHLVPETPHNTTTMLCHSKMKKMKEKKKETRESARQKIEDAKYDALPETEQFDIADGYVTFCQTFKYLGSRISYNL